MGTGREGQHIVKVIPSKFSSATPTAAPRFRAAVINVVPPPFSFMNKLRPAPAVPASRKSLYPVRYIHYLVRLVTGMQNRSLLCWLILLFLLGCLFSSCAAASIPAPYDNRTIRIVFDQSYPPYSFPDEKGNLQGIDVDQWRLWEKKTGIRVELVPTEWNEGLAAFKSGEYDAITGLFYTEDRAPYLDYAESFARIDVPVFFHKNISGISGVESLRGFVIAGVKDDASIDFLKQNGLAYKEYPTTEAIIKDAKAGNVVVFCVDKPAAIYFLYKYGIQDDFRYTPSFYSNDLRRAVHKGDTALLRTVNDGFAQISANEYQDIERRWLGESVISRQESENLLWTGVIIAIIALAGLSLVALWNRILHKTVERRTAELARKSDELQAAYEQLSSSEEELRQNYEILAQNECDLKESREQYRTVFENTGTATVVIEKDTTISMVNAEFENLTGYKKEEIEGIKKWTEFVVPEDLERMLSYHNARRADPSGAPRQYEFRFRTRNGELRNLLLKIEMIPGTPRSIASLLDITERKVAETALAQARRKLNVLNSVTFQDIQNAIFSLTGYHELERELVTNERLKKYVEKDIEALLRISDSLAFAKAYQDLGMNPPRWHNMAQIILYAISHLDLSHISRRMDLEGLEIYADPMLEKVFFELAGTAVRSEGGVTEIRIGHQESAGHLTLIFSDNGPGVAQDNKEKIFERESGSKSSPGLFLAREILSVTGITLRETGEPGKGTRFEMVVPKGAYRFVS